MKSKDITIIKPMCFFFIPPHTPQSTELVVDLYNLLLLFYYNINMVNISYIQ